MREFARLPTFNEWTLTGDDGADIVHVERLAARVLRVTIGGNRLQFNVVIRKGLPPRIGRMKQNVQSDKRANRLTAGPER